MARSTIKAGLESHYVKGSFLRTASITITGSLINVDIVKNLLLPYITSINLGTTILDVRTNGGGHATFIISNSAGYADALQLSYYLSGKLRTFHYDNGNWTVKDFVGTTVQPKPATEYRMATSKICSQIISGNGTLDTTKATGTLKLYRTGRIAVVYMWINIVESITANQIIGTVPPSFCPTESRSFIAMGTYGTHSMMPVIFSIRPNGEFRIEQGSGYVSGEFGCCCPYIIQIENISAKDMAISKIIANKIKFKDLQASGGIVDIDNIHDNIIYSGHFANSIQSTIGIPESIIPSGTYDVVVTFIGASWRYQLMMSMYNGNIIRRAYRNGAWTNWALVSTTSVGGGKSRKIYSSISLRWAA